MRSAGAKATNGIRRTTDMASGRERRGVHGLTIVLPQVRARIKKRGRPNRILCPDGPSYADEPVSLVDPKIS